MAYPYIPAKNHGGDDNLPITRIVIHGTVSPCVPGGARVIANYFATTDKDASTQYVVDPGEIVQCVRDDTVAYGAPPNTHVLHVELCDPQTGSGSRWSDDNHEAMLARAAGLVRDLCAKYDVPVRKLSAYQVRTGSRGICGHLEVSEAFGQTTHVDPGPDFPWAHFMDLVNGVDDMPSVNEIVAAVWGVKTTVLGVPEGESVITGLGRVYRTATAALTEGREQAAASLNRDANLQRQVDALKAQVAAITPATSQAVRDAIASGVVQVDVNINDGSAP